MTFQIYTCPNCNGVAGCHNYPCQGPFGTPYIPRRSDETGCRPTAPLTEADVRRIVREELVKQQSTPNAMDHDPWGPR